MTKNYSTFGWPRLASTPDFPFDFTLFVNKTIKWKVLWTGYDHCGLTSFGAAPAPSPHKGQGDGENGISCGLGLFMLHGIKVVSIYCSILQICQLFDQCIKGKLTSCADETNREYGIPIMTISQNLKGPLRPEQLRFTAFRAYCFLHKPAQSPLLYISGTEPLLSFSSNLFLWGK